MARSEGAGEEGGSGYNAGTADRDRVLSKKDRRPCYRYGNYPRYYSYRVGPSMEDHRLAALRRGIFEGKRCVDVGCHEGMVSLSLGAAYESMGSIAECQNKEQGVRADATYHTSTAVQCRTEWMIGIDIDPALVRRARAKLFALKRSRESYIEAAKDSLQRVRFYAGNIACGQPASALQEEWADVVLMLSVVKWIQLNNGDDGLRRAFETARNTLKPGGALILEPQPMKSYRQAFKKQRMPQEAYENFRRMAITPERLREFLLNTIGFRSCEELKAGELRGFDRDLSIYRK